MLLITTWVRKKPCEENAYIIRKSFLKTEKVGRVEAKFKLSLIFEYSVACAVALF